MARRCFVAHDGAGPLTGLASPIAVGRYHSLCTRDLPPRFTVHAEIEGMAMVFSDAEAMQTGLQFHPESILTPHGDAILRNILTQARATHQTVTLNSFQGPSSSRTVGGEMDA